MISDFKHHDKNCNSNIDDHIYLWRIVGDIFCSSLHRFYNVPRLGWPDDHQQQRVCCIYNDDRCKRHCLWDILLLCSHRYLNMARILPLLLLAYLKEKKLGKKRKGKNYVPNESNFMKHVKWIVYEIEWEKETNKRKSMWAWWRTRC